MEKSIEDTLDKNINTMNNILSEDKDIVSVDLNKKELKQEESMQVALINDGSINDDSNREVEILEYTQKEFGLIQFIKEEMGLKDNNIRSYSPLVLAFIGDVVYDLVIRTLVVEQGNAPVNKLHKKVSNLVKAPAQMDLFHKIEPILTEEEIGVYKRGRNAKSFTSAKNASITEYRIATGFEALMGYLYLDNKFSRIMQLIKYGLDK